MGLQGVEHEVPSKPASVMGTEVLACEPTLQFDCVGDVKPDLSRFAVQFLNVPDLQKALFFSEMVELK